MPEDSNTPPRRHGRHRPRLSELSRETTEEDLWNLDEQDEAAEGAKEDAASDSEEASGPEAPLFEGSSGVESRRVQPMPRESSRAQQELPEPPAKEPIEEPLPEEPVETPTPEEPIEEPAAEMPEPEVETPAVEIDEKPEPTPEPEVETQQAEEEPAETKPSPAPAPPVYTHHLPPVSRKEWMILGVFGAVVLGVVVWLFIALFSGVPKKSRGDDKPDYPVVGEFAAISGVDTFWREPIREGDNRDNARPEVELIPVINVTLDSEGGSQGVLRVLFIDSNGDYVGDPITESFTGGQFRENGSDTIEFSSTDGFSEDSDFHAYRLGSESWTVQILEGPSANAAGNRFKEILSVDVSARKD